MSYWKRTLVTVTAALILIGIWPGQRTDAMPASLLMFYGDPLKKPVLVSGDDARAFGDLQLNGSAPPPTTGRTFIKVAIFYGPADDPAVNRVPVDRLTPQMAWQHGRFYPATAGQPALLVVARMQVKATQTLPDDRTMLATMGPVSPSAVAVLKRLGIPTGPDR